jgi:Zn-dependent protease
MKLAFNLGSIPVRIHASFFLLTLFLRYDPRRNVQVADLVAWSIVVLISVLVHELGHAIVGKAFGLAPQIDLHGMGGLTSWASVKKLSSLKHIAISLAGPMVGLVIGGAFFFAGSSIVTPGTFAEGVVGTIVFVNFWWAVFNLLPIMPMDGGSVMYHVLDALTKGRGLKPARIVSMVLAVILGALAFKLGEQWIALLAALFAFQNFQAMRAVPPPQDDTAIRENLQRAYAALERHDGETAVHHARFVVDNARDPVMQSDGVRLLAFALLLIGAWGPLMQLMENGGASMMGDDELAKFERAASELGRGEEAQQIASLRVRGGVAPVPGVARG